MEFSYAGNAAIKAITKYISYGAYYKFSKAFGYKSYLTDYYANQYKYIEEFVKNYR